MAGAAIIANYGATQAERRHPALGRFVTAGGAPGQLPSSYDPEGDRYGQSRADRKR